ncbi:transcription regulator padr n-terminal [Trichococcus palustris]|jgi:PadR family transcriptional regulator, regulatory protein PadR|uniref:Transcription regulator padr n-terminal n=1 Tax=Trichococcus palustris TaxID=140314 RepID=A0A143YUP6_9LACT|nr:PadR family transcriptional regulator [Trichococcus palustris]CZQ99314.1 transcription regulator padr n-terminal [Trichococcus palustris]SFK87928.1 Transcriptional regulator PadR-like family protein [Trichococcus palustris]
MNVSKDLVAASATPLILTILKDNDSYGYAIIKRVKEMSRNQLIWTEGMLYPVLHRLEEKQLIESYWDKSEAGRQRKYYRIKDSGLEELELLRQQWEVVHAALTRTWNE